MWKSGLELRKKAICRAPHPNSSGRQVIDPLHPCGGPRVAQDRRNDRGENRCVADEARGPTADPKNSAGRRSPPEIKPSLRAAPINLKMSNDAKIGSLPSETRRADVIYDPDFPAPGSNVGGGGN